MSPSFGKERFSELIYAKFCCFDRPFIRGSVMYLTPGLKPFSPENKQKGLMIFIFVIFFTLNTGKTLKIIPSEAFRGRSKSVIIVPSSHYSHFCICVPKKKDESNFFRLLSNRSYIFNHTIHRTLAFNACGTYFDTSIIYYTIPFWNLKAGPTFPAGISSCWGLCSMVLWAAGDVCWPRCGDGAPELTGDIGWGIWGADTCGFLPEAFLTEPFFIAKNAGYHMAISGRTETNISLCTKLNLKGSHDNQGATEACCAKNHIYAKSPAGASFQFSWHWEGWLHLYTLTLLQHSPRDRLSCSVLAAHLPPVLQAVAYTKSGRSGDTLSSDRQSWQGHKQRIGSQLFLPKVEITHFAARRTNTKQKRKAVEKKKK